MYTENVSNVELKQLLEHQEWLVYTIKSTTDEIRNKLVCFLALEIKYTKVLLEESLYEVTALTECPCN